MLLPPLLLYISAAFICQCQIGIIYKFRTCFIFIQFIVVSAFTLHYYVSLLRSLSLCLSFFVCVCVWMYVLSDFPKRILYSFVLLPLSFSFVRHFKWFICGSRFPCHYNSKLPNKIFSHDHSNSISHDFTHISHSPTLFHLTILGHFNNKILDGKIPIQLFLCLFHSLTVFRSKL